MTPLGAAGLLAAAAGASWLMTARVRVYALRKEMLDVPNERSSHALPTPRGGGLAVVGVTLAALAGAWGAGLLAGKVAAAFIGGGAIIAATGWADDRLHLSPVVRAALQCLAAWWAVTELGGMPTMILGTSTATLGPFGNLLAVVFIMWSVNLFNFMDGIDGLATSEAVIVSLAGAAMLASRDQSGLALVALVVAGASAGFLRWNWSPARIFLGDVGSGFLGFMFGGLAVASERGGQVPVICWMMLGGVFVFDATVTLTRRVLHGERWYLPHRSHAYQRLIVAGWSHAQVTSSVLALDLVLAVLAWTTLRWPQWTGAAVAALLVGLAALYTRIERLRLPAPPSGVLL